MFVLTKIDGDFACVVRARTSRFGLRSSRLTGNNAGNSQPRVRAELMAIIAFHADLFRYSRLSRQIRSGIYQGNVPGWT